MMDTVRYYTVGAAELGRARFTDRQREILATINEKVGARDSLEAVLTFLAEKLREVAPCDRFSLAFVEEDGRRVVSRYTRAFYEPLLLKSGYAEDLAGSSLQDVIERGTPRVISDLAEYGRKHPDSRSTRILAREGVRSSLTCPLMVDGRAVGLLFRSARVPDAYDELQVRFHTAIAERLGQVVEKAYRIEQLAEANRQYFELLGFVTHELKSPLGSMLMDAGLLIDGYVGQLEEKQLELVRKMVAKGRYLLGLVGDYLELARMEGGQVSLHARSDVNLVEDVVEPAIQIVGAQLEARGGRITRAIPPDLPPVELDPSLVKIVLVNLLSNAGKYGHEDGEIRIGVELEGGRLRLAVRNEGEGFTPEQRNQLFRKFSRLQTPTLMKKSGTGVGLYTSWRIAHMHGGRMDAESEHGQWAEFTLTIPQPLVRGTEASSG
ncbi:MAG: GAF domain-containing sensor histidine kinase [Phycisphaerae bacterium]|nr:GAF domain-containing sensor histidine kinase [Phycisphaerae bacterium]